MKPMKKPRYMSRSSQQRKEYAKRLAIAVKSIPRKAPRVAAKEAGVSVGDLARVGRRKGLNIPLKRTGFSRKRV